MSKHVLRVPHMFDMSSMRKEDCGEPCLHLFGALFSRCIGFGKAAQCCPHAVYCRKGTGGKNETNQLKRDHPASFPCQFETCNHCVLHHRISKCSKAKRSWLLSTFDVCRKALNLHLRRDSMYVIASICNCL